MDLINSPLGFDQEVEGPGSRDSGALRADAGWLGLKFLVVATFIPSQTAFLSRHGLIRLNEWIRGTGCCQFRLPSVGGRE